MIRLIIFFLIFFLPTPLFAEKIQVHYAGFSYLGKYVSQLSGMPLTTQLIKEKKNNQNIVDYAITNKLKSKGYYKNGKKDGLWEVYDDDGDIEREINFRNGIEVN